MLGQGDRTGLDRDTGDAKAIPQKTEPDGDAAEDKGRQNKSKLAAYADVTNRSASEPIASQRGFAAPTNSVHVSTSFSGVAEDFPRFLPYSATAIKGGAEST